MKNGDTYETEEECKTRIQDMFDVDDVECFWNEDRMPPGFQAGPLPSGTSEKKDEDSVEVDPVEMAEAEILAEAFTETEDPNPPKKGFSDPEKEPVEDLVIDDVDNSPDTSEPIPSVDGARSYDIGKPQGLPELSSEFSKWPWTDGSDALLAKLKEETLEALEGTDLEPTVDGRVITVNGKSSISEMITIGIIAFKYASEIHSISPEDFVSLMVLRAREQYDRYHHTQDKLERSEEVV